MALRTAGGQGRLYEEIAELYSQNVNAAGDDDLAAAVRAAMQQIAAAVPDLPAQQASKYQNWLLTRYRQNWLVQAGDNPPQALLLEDLSKYVDDLALYHNTPNIIKKRAGISTDLFAIDNPFELYQQLKALRGEVATEFKPLSPTQQAFIDNGQAVIVGQTAQWRLVMPLTKEASQEFGSGTRWCTAAQRDNRFSRYFPENALLYLEASGIGKHAFVLQNGKITHLFDAEDTEQTAAQQQVLFDKLPTLTAFFSKLDAAVSALQPVIDKADFSTLYELIMASRNLAPHASINETALIKKANRCDLTASAKDQYLINTVACGLLKTTEVLLKVGADVHARVDAALRVAVEIGRTDMVKLLLKHGADVNANHGVALRWATQDGHADIVKLLLKHGAYVNANNGVALRGAALNGHTNVVRLLLKHGANVRNANSLALHVESQNRHAEIVKILKSASPKKPRGKRLAQKNRCLN